MPHNGIQRTAAALWARVVTPTSEVLSQCISSDSSPACGQSALSTDATDRPPPDRAGREHRGMRGPMSASAAGMTLAFAFLLAGSLPEARGADVPASTPPSRTEAALAPAAERVSDLRDRGWIWPLDAFRLSRPYAQPAHRYGAGHRGIDLAPRSERHVRAPADGVVAFSGRVADRGVLTIDHGDGLVTTLEPVASELVPGDPVGRGDAVGAVTTGGHAAAGTLHFGVRLEGEYINPLLLLGGVPRAVLLPCC